MKNTKKKIALIGAGKMIEEYLKALKSFKKIQLVGIHSRTIDKPLLLKKKYGVEKVCTSVENLYHETNAEAVIVAVSVENLYSVLKEVKRFNWICLSEKPFGYDFKEAKKIYKLFQNSESEFFLALNRRFYSSTISAKKILEKYKSTRFIQITDQQNILGRDIPFKVKKNLMFANSIHLIDYINIFCRGEVNKISDVLEVNQNKIRYICKKILCASGDIALYTAIWNAPERWSLNINTSEIRLELKPLEELKVQHKESRKINIIKINDADKKFKPGLKLIINELLRQIESKKSNLVTLDQSLKLMDLIRKIYGM